MPEKIAKLHTITISDRIQSSQQVGTDRDNFPIFESIVVSGAIQKRSTTMGEGREEKHVITHCKKDQGKQ